MLVNKQKFQKYMENIIDILVIDQNRRDKLNQYKVTWFAQKKNIRSLGT